MRISVHPRTRFAMTHVVLLTMVVSTASLASAAQRYPVTGLVLKVDKSHHEMLVSCQSIPGYMEAMAMPFPVPRESA